MLSFIIGVLIIANAFFWPLKYYFGDPPEIKPIQLESGFVIERKWIDDFKTVTHVLENTSTVVQADVIHFMQYDKVIYGYRKDVNQNPYYFLCTLGQDCSNTQNFNDTEFQKIIKQRKLPAYDLMNAKNYEFFLPNQ